MRSPRQLPGPECEASMGYDKQDPRSLIQTSGSPCHEPRHAGTFSLLKLRHPRVLAASFSFFLLRGARGRGARGRRVRDSAAAASPRTLDVVEDDPLVLGVVQVLAAPAEVEEDIKERIDVGGGSVVPDDVEDLACEVETSSPPDMKQDVVDACQVAGHIELVVVGARLVALARYLDLEDGGQCGRVTGANVRLPLTVSFPALLPGATSAAGEGEGAQAAGAVADEDGAGAAQGQAGERRVVVVELECAVDVDGGGAAEVGDCVDAQGPGLDVDGADGVTGVFEPDDAALRDGAIGGAGGVEGVEVARVARDELLAREVDLARDCEGVARGRREAALRPGGLNLTRRCLYPST